MITAYHPHTCFWKEVMELRETSSRVSSAAASRSRMKQASYQSGQQCLCRCEMSL